MLARYGIDVQLHDDRLHQTTVGRADGLQPKTLETFQMLRLGQDLLDTGVKVFDICMWRSEKSTDTQPTLRRVGREIHYPADAVDLLQPFILLCHQGMVEGIFVEDMRHSGIEVQRGSTFDTCSYETAGERPSILANFKKSDGTSTAVLTDYLVGCDGARSRVRQCILDDPAQGGSNDSFWAVLDGELDTDFPDIWSKTVVYSEQHGSVLIIPRERNLTRFYVEVKNLEQSVNEQFVMDQARNIMAPYTLKWLAVEWFGHYRVVQRVATRFSDADDTAQGSASVHLPQVFIAGDAAHTHSPKAAQGMNTSIHDAWNLGWKLNLAARGLAKKDVLLGTYESERKKIAHDLINFDYEHANSIASGDAKALADNFRTNIGFIAGVGVEYEQNAVNTASVSDVSANNFLQGAARPGRNLPPAKVTRYIDDNPVDIQLDIPALGQFRILILASDVIKATGFLRNFSDTVLSPSSLISRLSVSAARSYQEAPRPTRVKDAYYRPERYISQSDICTFGLISKQIRFSPSLF